MNIPSDVGRHAIVAGAIFVFFLGVTSNVTIRFIARVWPRSDPVRRELVANLQALPLHRRPLYVADQVTNAICDGLPSRFRQWQARHQDRLSIRLIIMLPIAAWVVFAVTPLAVFLSEERDRPKWESHHDTRVQRLFFWLHLVGVSLSPATFFIPMLILRLISASCRFEDAFDELVGAGKLVWTYRLAAWVFEVPPLLADLSTTQ